MRKSHPHAHNWLLVVPVPEMMAFLGLIVYLGILKLPHSSCIGQRIKHIQSTPTSWTNHFECGSHRSNRYLL